MTQKRKGKKEGKRKGPACSIFYVLKHIWVKKVADNIESGEPKIFFAYNFYLTCCLITNSKTSTSTWHGAYLS